MDLHPPAEVYIVDDDPGIRNSLLMLAESEAIPASAYASAEEFLADFSPVKPACLVLDLRMPGMSGLELLQRLRVGAREIQVILISAHAEVSDAVRGMKLGAVDLLQKPVEPGALIDTIRRSLELSQSLTRSRIEADAIRQRFDRLTERERQLLKHIVDGLVNKQIATRMGIAIKTVANHRASLMAKSGATNAADLARLYTMYSAQIDPDESTSASENTLN